jgi:dihydroneopterin aldolase/2-amino-4-hydroxy-6-hydroxymethyldihydropteridine diphosphokinase
MTDSISIKELRVPARIGVTEDERAKPQPLVLNIDVHADLARAGQTDDLDDTIDYDSLVRDIADLVRGTEVKLLETMAELVAGRVSKVKGANGVTVEVLKENVPVQEDVGEVSVRIERKL